MKTRLEMFDAAGASDSESAVGVTVGEVRRWARESQEMGVAFVKNAIKCSEANILLREQQEKVSRLQEDVVTLNRIAVRAEAKLREAAEL